MPDDAHLWQLLRDVVARADAWPALLAALEPEVVAMARHQPIGRLRQGEDSAREIATRVFERLHARDFAGIHRLCELDPPPELRAWLRVIVRRSAIDYMREHAEYQRATAARPHAWISLATLTSAAPAPGRDSLADQRELVVATVREMAARAEAEHARVGDDAFGPLALEWRIPRLHVRRLATRGAQLQAVLAGLIEGHSQGELAERLGTTRREVELSVRYLEELLQARFAEP